MSIIEEIDRLIDEDESYRGLSVYDIAEALGGLPISDEIVDQTRWSIVSEIVVKFGDEYVMFIETTGATEQQEDDPLTKDDYFLVVPKEVTVTKYVRLD